MYDWIGDDNISDNIIEAEYNFERTGKMIIGNEYVITIQKK